MLKTNIVGLKAFFLFLFMLSPHTFIFLYPSKSSTSIFISASSSTYLHLVILGTLYFALVLYFSVLVPLWLSPEHVLSNWWCFLTLIVFPIHVSSQLLLSDWWAQWRKSPSWHFNLTVSTSLVSSKCIEIILNSSEEFQGQHSNPLGWEISIF